MTSSLRIAFLSALLLTPQGVHAQVTVKHYEFGPFYVTRCDASGVACASMDFAKPRSGSVVGAQLGVGGCLDAWGRSFDIGLVDTLRDYNGRTMHDLGVFIGIVLPIWSRPPED